ncbi:MAG: thioredoxin-dependent thiol peroxidase [Gammaproteobacteria bacterium]|nr:thioredoxin-dependent thiol peroxidase [Gammaproteobacteria bacterium]
MTLTIGEKAPDFSLYSDENKLISLHDLRGKNIVLYFYPKDDTPGCTKEACDFRDNISSFENKNTIIIGISKDSVLKHQRFKEKYQLPFILLADKNGDVCETYGVLDKKSLFGKTFLGIQRSTFLIDENGIIQAVWPKVKVNGHFQQVLDELH